MLSTFLGNITSSGLARKNRFRMDLFGNGPQSAGGFRQHMAMMCESIEFPGQNMMSSADTLRFGPQREFINGVTYGAINASFIMSPDMYIKRFFERWQEQTMDMTTWEPKYYEDYIGGAKIYQLDRDNSATYVVELFEVYPKTITAQDVGNAQADAYQTLAVELEFHHWKFANERTQTSAQVDDFSGMPTETGNTKGGGTDPGTTPLQSKEAYMAAQSQGNSATTNVTVKKGIITVPPGTKTKASWPSNPHR